MRAITSLIDQCPRDLLKALGESLSDALATWLADADDKWEKGVIEYDIVALYETLLASIQGRASIHLLSAFGPILSAPLGQETRQEIREPAVEAFKEFWNSTYANADIPEGGWDRDVEACLTSVFGASKEEVIAELEPAFTLRPTTPTPNSTLSVPSTPRSSLSDSHFTPETLSTPPRPSKAARPFAQFSMQSPVSPMPSSSRLSALSHPPTPRTGRSSPAKRRKLVHGDKENVSPSKNISITSVIDRIIASSPVATKAVLGKRRFEEDTHLVGSSEDDRNTVESLLLPSKSDVFFVSSSSTSNEPRATYKKRKRVTQDDPSNKHSLRPSASFELPHVPSTHKWSVRRTSSESTMSGHEMAHSRKRRKEEMESDGEEVVCFGEMPLRALVPSENHMSPAMYRPYSLVRRHSKSMVPSSEISSDDDPRLGQVTPHHLISPDIRRGKNTRPQDPPSDDSDVMPSPSRDLVERRLQRTGSGSIVKITPFIVL
ncbi:hypothetical protein H0H93_009374 [Arthromyces matolae]|nr:hypothetical protein H0H93_009374 [Arthromyces matolae]